MSQLQLDGLSLPQATQNLRAVEERAERRFHWQSALLLESVRRQTFADWTVPFVDPDQLAKAGFFYLRTEDHVQCVFCQGIVGYWDPGDHPEVEHRKHFPNCPFVTGVATGNVPRVSTDTQDSALYALMDEYHAFRLASTRPQQPDSGFHTDAVQVADSGRLAFPHFNTPSSRLQTFRRWPQDTGVAPEQLVEAGFFSTGLADWVQCFNCGGGLYGWRKGDDPLADHARFYPSCPFIRMQKGNEDITNAMKSKPAPTAKNRALALSDQEAELLLLHPIAKRLVGMGLSQVSVKEALRRRLQNRGVLCRTVTDALELVFDYEEDQRKKSISPPLLHDGAQIENQTSQTTIASPTPMQVEPSMPFSPGVGSQDQPSPHVTSDHTRLLQEVEELQRQVVEAESRLLCRKCKRERVAVVFQPCSHLHLCADCARPQDSCTTCGTIVRGTLRPIIG
ncbi:baculoviral IAP repeat-containing protein 7 [Procambarus clarkii]|uniref:baculoviral IAP repeat-containing protein 7 n=1 Tax=Procambarus clarkii TaxID=6728 RepID=UPI001E670C3F|nr:baculoviral IAP repeat-containing protein 7-B-like [Procambarus clarkii]